MGKILLVEDNHAFGLLLKRELEQQLDLAVVWTKTLEETQGLLATATDTFSIALLDYNLPDAPNGEVIHTVVSHGITAIVFTGNITETVRNKVWAKRVADYIVKTDPNSLGNVITTIKRLIQNNRTKVLVVEDSSFFRKMFSDLLYIHKFRVLTAINGENALEVLKSHPAIKLMIVDYNMPVMDGCTLCQRVRETHKKEELAIIGTSASIDNNMAARFIKSGANDFIVKESFFIEEFYCRVNQSIENVELFKATREAAIRDFLTGLYNRRYLLETGSRLFAELKGRLACAMVDIDFFKKVNDTFGHDVGDLVIQQVASIIEKNMEKTDIVARFGGEEFCVLLPGTPPTDLGQRFSALRKTIESTPILFNHGKQSLNITVSMGICTQACDSLYQLVNSADELLYKAKHQGRNRVVFSAAVTPDH